MATKTSLLGLTKPAYTDAADIAVLNGNFDLIDKAVGQGARVGNLLDNSWFGNPINQRGSTEVSTDSDSYFIDRWVGYQGTFSLRNNSIQIQANRQYGALLQQFVQKLEDGVYTFAGKVDGSIVWRVVQISGNTVTTLDNNNAAFSNGAGYLYVQTQGDKVYNFHFRANVGYTIVVEWAALYEGAYTADTLPAYVYKGYAAELAECQRYFQQVKLANGYLTASAFSSTSARTVLFIPRMRIPSPSVTTNNTLMLAEGSKRYEVTGMSLSYSGSNNYNFTLTTSGLTEGKIYPIYPNVGNFPATLSISADL